VFGPYYPTGHIIVYGFSGTDLIQVNATEKLPAIIFGGTGKNDTLIGGAGNDIIIGGSGGGNTIEGSGGRNLLIAGGGTGNKLYAYTPTVFTNFAAGGSILIDGTTTFETNFTILGQIMSTWTSSLAYATRIADLRPTLNEPGSITFLALDQLFGGGGTNWYWYNTTGGTTISHKLSTEQVN
jgi:hypothetical protein